MKYLKLDDTIWADGYEAKVYSLPNDKGTMQIILDKGLWSETIYNCNIQDVSLDNDGEWVLNIEIAPVIGDVVKIDEKEFQLVYIDEGVVTLKRGDKIRYYSFYDIEWDIKDGYWISSFNEQVVSPSARRKLEVYEVQDNVYLYKSLEELKDIYHLLNKPLIQGSNHTCINTLSASLQYDYGMLHYWENWDSDWDYTYKYIKVIQGATFIEEY